MSLKEDNIRPHQFEPGQSGNPNGRPKGVRNRATIVRQWLEVKESVKNPITHTQEILEQQDIITLALISKARKGDVNAYKELMDSCFGKLSQSLDHNISETPKLEISVNSKEDADNLRKLTGEN